MKPVPIDFPVEDLLCYCGCICMCAQGCVCVFTHVCAQGCVCVCPVHVCVCVCVCVCALRGRVCLCQGLPRPSMAVVPGAQGRPAVPHALTVAAPVANTQSAEALIPFVT